MKLRFEIDGDFLIRPRGDSYWELGIWPWFPQPALAGQAYTWHAVVRVPKPFVPFAPGTTVRREEEGGLNVLETRLDKPVQFAVILAGDYDMEEEVRDGVTIRVATYALDNPRGRKQLTKVAAEIIAYYREFLGPFPFPEFNILEINDYGFGQAPPATMFITKEAFDPLVGDMSRFEAQQIAKMFAHEIAHQYWGIVVRIPSAQEQWLAESFSEYCAFLFLRDRRSPAVARGLEKRWRRGADFAGDAAPIPLANRVWVSRDAIRRAEIRSGLLYDKGPILLGALHRQMGDEAFRRLSEVGAVDSRLEVREHEGDRRPAPGRRRAGPGAVLQQVLLGRRDAEGLTAGSYHFSTARVAELADARDLGSRGVKPLRVRVPPLAP